MRSEHLAIGLMFVVLAVLACLAPAQSDTWWLLRAGRDIWQTRHVALVDTYSHTAAGLYWPNQEWLTELTFFALYSLGGMWLVAAACAAAIVSAWALAYWMTRGGFEARLLLLAACVVPAAGSFALRPQAFTMFFFALACLLLSTGRIWWTPLLILVWANFHGAVALGLVATFAAAGVTLATDRRIPWRLVAVSGLAVAATALTPMGTQLWQYWIDSPARSRANQLIEWTPPGFSPELWPFWAVSVVLPLLAAFRWRRLDLRTRVLVGIAVGVTPLAFQAIRNVHVYLIAALPAMTSVLAAGQIERPARRAGEHGRANAAILAAVATLAAVFVGLVWMRPPAMLGWTPMAPTAIAAVRDCPGRLFNTYGGGGPLIWFVPERPVFIDNRQDPFPMDLLQANHDVELGADPAPLFARYDVQCAILPPDSPVVAFLERSADWSRTYADDDWQVFAHAGGSPQRDIKGTGTRE